MHACISPSPSSFKPNPFHLFYFLCLQDDLNSLFVGPEFSLANRLSVILNVVFVAIVYGGGKLAGSLRTYLSSLVCA